MTWKYQIALIALPEDRRAGVVQVAVKEFALDLGSDVAARLRIIRSDDVASLDSRSPVAGVFFGGAEWSDQMATAAHDLVANHSFILPVVPSLDQYRVFVPPDLHPINGTVASTDDELRAIALRLIEELGLVRQRRQAFVSYCRQDSAKAAQQVYQALDQRGWQVFLDTHSVTTGVPFQPALWDRLNDADLMVLLDTPGAVASHWVEQELARASNLGIGLLQLVWPGHARVVGSDFAHAFYLDGEHFRAGSWTSRGGRFLRAQTVRTVALTAESIRARCVAARRTRLVGELTARARALGINVAAQPERYIEVRGRAGNHVVIPVIGTPRSGDLQKAEQHAHRGQPRLLYDPAGLLDSRRAHLEWLNAHLPVATMPTSDLSAWLETA